MSAEAVQAFIEAVKADEVLQAKLKQVVDQENIEAAIVALGKEAGFDFTAEEWLEEQLSGVAGGMGGLGPGWFAASPVGAPSWAAWANLGG